MKASQKTRRQFCRIRGRLGDIDMSQAELAGRLNLSAAALSARMTGRQAWKYPEMCQLVKEIGEPDETLDTFFPFLNDRMWSK